MTDQQVIDILQNFDGYLIESNIFLSGIRWLGWIIIKGLVSLVNTLEGAIRKVIGLTNFFESPEITKLINDFKPAIFMFLALSLACVAFLIFFSKKFDKKSVPTNIFLATMAILLLPFGMSKLNELTQAGINVVYGEFNSMANETVKNNIIDVYKYDENSFSSKEVSPKNYIEKDKIVMIDINEGIDKSQTSNEKVFENKVVAKKGGGYELKRIDGLFKIDSYYYRWKCNFWIIIISLLSTTATLSLSILKIGRLVFELAFNKVFGILIAYLDVASGQRLKKVVQRILTLFAVMFCMALMLKIYLIFTTWIGSRNLGILEVIMMIVVSSAVIDGPNIVEEILGVDAGLNSAWKTIAGLYAGSKMAGELAKVVGKATTGLAKFMSATGSKMAEGVSAGIGFGSGIREGKRSNLENEMKENRAKNKDASKSSSLEGQMKKEGYDSTNKPLENYNKNIDKNNSKDTLDKDIGNSKNKEGKDPNKLDKILNDELLQNQDSDKKSENSDEKTLENDKGNIKNKEDENKNGLYEKMNSSSDKVDSNGLENDKEDIRDKNLGNKLDNEGKSTGEINSKDDNLLNENNKPAKDSGINKDNLSENKNLKESGQVSGSINKGSTKLGKENLEGSLNNNPGISEDKLKTGSIESNGGKGNNGTLNEGISKSNNGNLTLIDSLVNSTGISEDKAITENVDGYSRLGNNEKLNEDSIKINNGSLNSANSLMDNTIISDGKSTIGSMEKNSNGSFDEIRTSDIGVSSNSINSSDISTPNNKIIENRTFKDVVKDGFNNSKVGKEVIKVKRSYQIGKNTGKKYVERKNSKKERKNK